MNKTEFKRIKSPKKQNLSSILQVQDEDENGDQL